MNRLYFADERRFACLFVLWRSAEGTPAWKKSKQVLFIRSLIRTLAIAEGTSVDFVFLLLTRHSMQASSALVSFVGSEILKQVWYFARLFVPLHIHTRKRQYITNYKILLNI